ncbi:hypothetical protein BAUCODRAFT_30055 [Baudoinia panamericana UAMH 10762]|uniref:HhH-GPD domain-containing protein n=1 Tax=Baudoinia panamericana (strain UAMH 10762) TaxID=717646 RepID=M2MS51_BAUPA|nr:uncharacterized protein BAUCODRAFT_30055 [Baudoinia panamericana UAMH 10762]EMC99676.1 hypothetical protein BAUCODRAFT_30055 [Baudoinia panamericana UAMH 10762]
MAPKKRATKAKVEQEADGATEAIADEAPPIDEPLGENQSHDAEPEETVEKQQPSKKRKKATKSDEPQKAARRSGRGAPKSKPSEQQLLNYMLSHDAEELCRPEDETADIKERGDIRTYSSSVLSPFEELLCAAVLSRPISHRLGLRTIRTILNKPYRFISARAVKDAGPEQCHEAVWAAHTQHKQKTAEEISHIADVVLEKFTSTDDKEGRELRKVRDECGGDIDRERELIKSSVKGIGKTGLDIFFRRVQWQWDSAFPFVDDRTARSLRNLGLPDDSKELEKLLNEHWSSLDTKHLAGGDKSRKQKRAFVVLLERATGSDLENKTEAVIEAAAGTAS